MVCAIKSGIKGDAAGWEVEFPNKGSSFGGAVDAVHANVFPFDRKGAVVADVIESDDDVFKLDIASPWGSEVPVSASIAKVRVAAKDADRAVAVAPPSVFHVDMIDSIGEFADEANVIDPLISEVRGVEIKAKAWVVVDGVESALSGCDIKSDFSGVDFECEVDVFCLKGI